MKRIGKVIEKDAVIPELRYLVLCEAGAIVWNGAVGIRYHPAAIGRLADLIKQHGRFAILDALQFLKVTSVLDKVQSAEIDTEASVLKIKGGDGKMRVTIPITLDVPDTVPHLGIDWHDTENRPTVSVPIERVWNDAADLITKDGVNLWGDVVGVYATDTYVASFDYGVLLYEHRGGKRFGRSKGATHDMLFCPHRLLDLGLASITTAEFREDGVFLVGENVEYFTTQLADTRVLEQQLNLRTQALAGTPYSVSLNFSASMWRRAKVFSKAVLTLTIRDGRMTLKADDWSEVVGMTDAPEATFVTRISLLERWTVGSVEHRIHVAEDGWYLYGKTRKGSEFFGSLTAIDGARGEDGFEEWTPDAEGTEESDGSTEALL